MLRLTGCAFEGLKGFEKLELTELDAVTTLIGPNGTGKSTILKVLYLALTILSNKTLSDKLPTHEPWHRFSKATLNFLSTNAIPLQHFAEKFDQSAVHIKVEITCTETEFRIETVGLDEIIMISPANVATKSRLRALKQQVAEIKKNIEELDKTAASHQQHPNMHQQVMQLRGQVTTLKSDQSKVEQELDSLNSVSLAFSNSNDPSETNESLESDRSDVDSFLGELHFPPVRHIDTGPTQGNLIPDLINLLLTQKKGNWKESAKYSSAMKQLGHILQSSADVYEEGANSLMNINGVSYEKASTGTHATLSFFGVTKLEGSDSLILWDEPENGLHPTRRSRLLELMFEDGRQFVVASHASEFAPVFFKKGKVFRCDSDFDQETEAVKLKAIHVADRRDAFAALEVLGVHPARTLFTANVVIWVEGPTELLFYRHWLNPRLDKHGLHEGYHYTYMQYGGALIAYLSMADDKQFESTFDLLSISRHPVILADSDLRHDPGEEQPQKYLKVGAFRLLEKVEKMNKARPDAGIFQLTTGREIENYLPSAAIHHALRLVWKESEKYRDLFNVDKFEVGQYEAFDEAIKTYLLDLNLKDKEGKPLGRSCWNNKVLMMEHALKFNGLAEDKLSWGCSAKLKEVEDFILRKCTS